MTPSLMRSQGKITYQCHRLLSVCKGDNVNHQLLQVHRNREEFQSHGKQDRTDVHQETSIATVLIAQTVTLTATVQRIRKSSNKVRLFGICLWKEAISPTSKQRGKGGGNAMCRTREWRSLTSWSDTHRIFYHGSDMNRLVLRFNKSTRNEKLIRSNHILLYYSFV